MIENKDYTYGIGTLNYLDTRAGAEEIARNVSPRDTRYRGEAQFDETSGKWIVVIRDGEIVKGFAIVR